MNYKPINLHTLIKRDDELFEFIRALPMSMFVNKKTHEIDKTVLQNGMSALGGNHVLQENNHFLICKRVEDTQYEPVIETTNEHPTEIS